MVVVFSGLIFPFAFDYSVKRFWMTLDVSYIILEEVFLKFQLPTFYIRLPHVWLIKA